MRQMLFVTVAIALFASRASAQTAAQKRLQAAGRVACTFSTMATATWTSTNEIQAQIKPAKLSFTFGAVNIDEGTAQLTSGIGNYEIIVRFADNALHFLQSYRNGPLYSTTLFDRENAPGKFRAVHTRHEYAEVSLPGFTSRPEQYYGECEVTPK